MIFFFFVNLSLNVSLVFLTLFILYLYLRLKYINFPFSRSNTVLDYQKPHMVQLDIRYLRLLWLWLIHGTMLCTAEPAVVEWMRKDEWVNKQMNEYWLNKWEITLGGQQIFKHYSRYRSSDQWANIVILMLNHKAKISQTKNTWQEYFSTDLILGTIQNREIYIYIFLRP